MLAEPKILVTGATGFIGRHLIPGLKSRYSDVYAFVRRTSNTSFIQEFGVPLRYGDLLDKDSIKEGIKDIDIIIHLGALMSNKDYLPREEFYKVNVLGTKNLIEESSGKIRQFIHISTVGVYGATDEFGVDESCPYGSRLSDYEYSKAESERVIMDFASRQKFPYSILRLGQLYGPYMYYGWPEIFERIEKRHMFILGKGDKLLHLTYISDVICGIMLVIENQKCINQIFNICAQKAHSLKEIFYTIAEKLNKPFPKSIPVFPVYLIASLLEALPYRIKKKFSLKYVSLHRLSFFCQHRVYKIDKAREVFNYNPQIDLYTGIEKTIKWYLESKEKGYQDE